MAAETPLETTLQYAAAIRTKAGEKEIADLEAIMSGNTLHFGQYKTKLDAITASVLALYIVLLNNAAVSEPRAKAVAKLREFFEAAMVAASSLP